MKSLISSLMALFMVLAVTPATLSAQTTPADADMSASAETSGSTILALASENQDLSTLVAAIEAAGLTSALSGEGTLTVFAPTNAAFEQLPAGVLEALLMPENKETLVNILKYHVTSNKLSSTDIADGIDGSDNGNLAATTMNGDLTVRTAGDAVMIQDAMGTSATVQQADIMASNGVIHLIDRVLVPANVDVTTLAGNSAMGMARQQQDSMQSDMNDMQEDMTAKQEEMATDMNRMKEDMKENKEEMATDMNRTKEDMKEHKEEMATDMNRTKEDMKAEQEGMARDMQGRTPDYNSGTTTSVNSGVTANTASNPNSTIVDVAKNNSNFSSLADALKSAELVDILSSNGEFTVFAPTNDAFTSLPDSVSSSLMQSSGKEQLKQVLTYHVVASKITAADLKQAIEKKNGYFRIQTMGGGSLIASINEEGNVILTDGNGEFATITETDIEASNGLIHVIDGVLTPRQ